MIVGDGSGGRDVDRGAPGAARAGPEGAGGGVRGGGDRGLAGAGRPAAERAGDAGPARGRRDRLALAGGRALARPAGRLARGAGGGRGRALRAVRPPWRTVYGWFRRWLALGLFDALLREVARRRRRKGGRRRRPTLAIIDTQVTKCVAVRGPRGYDAAKGVLGRKRVALVDAEGHRLAVAVVPASVQGWGTAGGRGRGGGGGGAGGGRGRGWGGGAPAAGFAAGRCREWSNVHGMRHRVVARDPQAEGFVPLARRWVVERSFGWLSHWGGLARDRAARLDVSAARLALVGILSGFEALLNPMPVRAP